MPEPTRDRSRARWFGPIVAVVVAIAVFWWVARSPEPSSVASGPTGSTPGTAAEVVEVQASSAVRFAGLDDLVRASDLVVQGTVVQTSRGRLVGSGDDAIVSRIVTLRIDEVLRGEGRAPGDRVLVEEEGWLTDGRLLSVNGAAPSATGDTGIWFLQAVHDPELTGFTSTNGQGRYLVRPDAPDALTGSDQQDPLVQELQRLTPDELRDAARP